MAEKAITVPSGDHVGLKISPISGNTFSRTMSPVLTSTTVSTGSLPVTAPNTKRSPAGLQAPADRMNWILSKCGSVRLSTNLLRISPVSASARNMSSENTSRIDKNTSSVPSGLSTGAMFIPLPLSSDNSNVPYWSGSKVASRMSSYARLTASCHSAFTESGGMPITCRRAVSAFLDRAAALRILPTTSSPKRPAMYAQNAWPNRYGKNRGSLSCRMVGSFSCTAASRIHIAVCGSAGPTDKYSAIPSMNHSGNCSAWGKFPMLRAPSRLWVMSN